MPETGSGDVYLRFIISTDSPSRSRATGVWEESEVTVSERIINTDDVRLYLFSLDDRLICEVTPSDIPYISEGNDGYYTVTASINRSDLRELANNDRIEFKIAVAANLGALGAAYPPLPEGESYGHLDPVFSMPSAYYPSATSGIPMYGVGTYSISRSSLELSSEARPYEINEDIPLLRSLCKIELYDRISNKVTVNGIEYPYIGYAEMTSWNVDGYLRFSPSLDAIYMQDRTVTSARIKENPSFSRKSFIHDDSGSFRIYLPEGRLDKSTLSIYVTRGPGEEPTVYDYELSNATTFATSDLIRNHIYRLELTRAGITAEISPSVKPWVNESLELNYTGDVSMTRYLEWDTSASGDITVTEGSPSTKPILHIFDTSGRPVHGCFEISSPSGTTWTMQIIPGSNGVDAFEFVRFDEAGAVVSTSQIASGTTGELSHIYLRSKVCTASADAYADIVISVRDAEGYTCFAPLDSFHNEMFGVVRHKPASQNMPAR